MIRQYRVLSLTQPWASLVVLGPKREETRSWSTPYRGLVLIHASKGFPRWARELCLEEPFRSVLREAGITRITDLPLGQILGGVTIADVRWVEDIRDELSEQELAFGDYSDNRYAWSLTNPHQLITQIQASGSLGLWKWCGDLDRLWRSMAQPAREAA